MFKATVLLQHPVDPPAYDKYYLDTHIRLARKVPGVLKVEVTVFDRVHDGSRPPYHLMAELYFADEASWEAGMASAEGQELIADGDNLLPTAGPGTMYLGRVVLAPHGGNVHECQKVNRAGRRVGVHRVAALARRPAVVPRHPGPHRPGGRP